MTPVPAPFALRGQTLTFTADPFVTDPGQAIRYQSDGAAVIRAGRIEAVGEAQSTLARFPGIAVERHAENLIMAGFIDSHVHYPQTGMIASYGAQLIEWLNRYTFPAELEFADEAHASRMAEVYLDEALCNGVTTASVYCTTHPHSVDAFFAAATARGVRMAAGKVMMDRNAPAGLLDTAERGYDESKALIARWHDKQRLTYAITPRFAPTSTEAQLEAAGTLWREHPTALVQTHICESPREIDWVRELFPGAADYLDVYDRAGLLAPGANLGHAIHLSERELARLRESGAAVSHCPTSNTFIGSGLFDLAGLRRGPQPVPVGLATDIGGGSSFSMFATMKAAYEIAQLRGTSLHPVQAYYLATLGSARALRLERVVGNLAPGFDADIIVIDLKSRPLIAERLARARDIGDVLFAQMILADDRAIKLTYALGRKVYERPAIAG